MADLSKQYNTIENALAWYGEQVVALAAYSLQKNTDAMMACVTALSLDAGGRASKALNQHPDDKAVNEFVIAMKTKLAAKRDEGYYGWHDQHECTTAFLQDALIGHVIKGDPIDVANFCMFLFTRGAATRPSPQDHGWIVWNEGPGAWFWVETFEKAQHELSSDIRPATALEKAFFNANGNRWGGA
jgi:hypothetical protein